MRKAFFIILAFGLVIAMFACGGAKEYKCPECGEVFESKEALDEHVAEAHTAEETVEPTDEAGEEEPAEETADVAAMKEEFKAVFNDVNNYMETHNQGNTGPDGLSAAYGDFAAAFAEMNEKFGVIEPTEVEKAEYDKILGLMDKAATSMSKYSEGIAKGVPDGLQLSLEGATLWDEVKKDFAGAA